MPFVKMSQDDPLYPSSIITPKLVYNSFGPIPDMDHGRNQHFLILVRQDSANRYYKCVLFHEIIGQKSFVTPL